MIREILVFGQNLAHEGPTYPEIDKGFSSKIRFETTNLEHKILKKTFTEPILAIRLPKCHHKS